MQEKQVLVDPAGQPSELGDIDHADRHRLAVAQPEALDLLDRMPERVAVVEDLPAQGAACGAAASPGGRCSPRRP